MAISDYVPFVQAPPARFVSEAGKAIHGITAEFETTADVTHAAEAIRDAGFTKWDIYAPFPVHGLDEAMGVKRTILPVLVACGAFTGVGCALALQWWTNYIDYPMVVQGKPFDAFEPFVPVTFELGVLFSAFTAILGMLALNGLPRWNHPLFKKSRFLACSDDKFIVCIEARDPKFNPGEVRRILQSLHGSHIDLVEDE